MWGWRRSLENICAAARLPISCPSEAQIDASATQATKCPCDQGVGAIPRRLSTGLSRKTVDNSAAQKACILCVVCVLRLSNQRLGVAVQKLLTGLPTESVEKHRRVFPRNTATATIGNFARKPSRVKHLRQSSHGYAQGCPRKLWIAHPDVDRGACNLAQCGSSTG